MRDELHFGFSPHKVEHTFFKMADASSVLLVARVRMKKREGTAEFSEKALRWTPDAAGPSSTAEVVKPVVVLWTTVQEQQVRYSLSLSFLSSFACR